jgi:hypothetical protein
MDCSASSGFGLVCPFLPGDFPDQRLLQRARRSMRASVDGHFHHRPETPALRRGKGRFCHNKRTAGDALLRASARFVPEPLLPAPVLLCAEDTMLVRVGKDVLPLDAGPLRHANDMGHVVHDAFGLRPGSRKPEVWLGALVWTRSTDVHLQDHKSRAPEERESLKWSQLRLEIHRRLRKAGFSGRVVSLNDREGDCWTSLWLARKHHHELITRFTQNRLLEEDTHLKRYLSRQPLAVVLTMPIYGSRKDKHRPRKAEVELRWTEVTLWPPKSASAEQFEPTVVVALHLYERRPPRGKKRFESFLLTTCEVVTDEQAVEVVYWYGHRWGGSEVGHDILKNGLELELMRIRNVEATKKLVALEGPVAAHAAQWVAASRQAKPPAVKTYFDRETLQELRQACVFWRVPLSKGWTLPKVVEALARVGGAEVRPDRLPGWRVVLRGWRRFEEFRSIRAFRAFSRDGQPRAAPLALRLAAADDEPEGEDQPRAGPPTAWKILR